MRLLRAGKKIFHGSGNFRDVCFESEMSGIEELDSRVGQIFAKCLCSGGNEKWIVLAPDRQQRGLRFPEIFLELWIELYVRRVVEKQIQLDLFVSRSLKERRIQCVRLRRNILRIDYTVRVLPACSTRRQDALAEYGSVVWRRFSPILSDRPPRIAEPFFVGISIL